MLEQLREVTRRHAKTEVELVALARERDELVRKASALRATRRDVADAAGLTPGRVQQLVR